jgi:hypothetical protein
MHIIILLLIIFLQVGVTILLSDNIIIIIMFLQVTELWRCVGFDPSFMIIGCMNLVKIVAGTIGISV